MSGHSKWSTIKRAKGAADLKRGQQFSKLSKAITVAAKQGGADPNGNPRLRLAIDAARSASMPKDNIARAIEKATAAGADNTEEVLYEGYGPGGAALLVEALTDNRNRTVAEVRSIFTKLGGSMSEAGSVAWMFSPQAVIQLNLGQHDPEEVSMIAIENGASDLEIEDATVTVLADPGQLTGLLTALEAYGQPEAQFQLVPSNTIELDPEAEVKLVKLLESLEDHEEISRVSTNASLGV